MKEEKERAKAEAAAAVAAATGRGLAPDPRHYSYSLKDVAFSLDDFEGTFFFSVCHYKSLLYRWSLMCNPAFI